ncbi:MAG: AbrB/MazE/SpoVT family DNA-binding domain-containing protein [Armatimonadota bacterium]|nr:AbrB/MazE/SpoVT family DNA-binding domain-containing protein [Armatimonadota bacterium]MDR7451501.1 AbrB/MazE/SpoVT family DNA-binding domain-containing protein [Armatimonadota bacterium]MDR7467468.1 AbrB/MazE/SpoVT family DNA-binding domain-containing protein [Armatimonadota bacterium]MDR7494342.1 AbrB/MazE/SpoVT family DNA-binding domain-containing protein [Armatimonadota bacterium]MDR7499159.1 AbrB/MazE/SpoVT family DNA-binding domain-containing protein [Armatimonadota bacterium]
MAKVTSKLQVTVPKTVAKHFGIRPGDEIEWVIAGDAIRVLPARTHQPSRDPAERLRLFDLATARQRNRNASLRLKPARQRGWTRQDLYARARPR